MKRLKTASPGGQLHYIPPDAVERLTEELDGRVYVRGQKGYEEARAIWNGMVDAEPALVACPADAAEVAATVRLAGDHDIALGVRGGGHNVAGSALVQDGLTINLSRMRSVAVDPAARLVRAQGGATLADLDASTQRHGLAVPSGFVSETGLGGLCLRGGLGHLMRRFGLTCDNLAGAQMVTADGKIINTSSEENPELLWALRGGGVNLGVVTSFELKAHRLGPKVMFLMPIYPADKGTEALRVLQEFVTEAPEELGVTGFYSRMSDNRRLPQSIRNRDVFVFYGCYSGPRERAEEATRPLRSLGKPLADFSKSMAFTRVQKFLDKDYPDGGRYYWRSLYLDTLAPELIQIIHEYATSRPSPASTVDVWALGGAVRRVGPADTAFFQRDASFLVAIEGNWEAPADDAANVAWVRRATAEIDRFSSHGAYLNFVGSREDIRGTLAATYGPNLDRLSEIKRSYDPDDMFG
jgi:hypothetical protein